MEFLILKSVKDDFECFFLDKMQGEQVRTVPVYKYKSGFGWKITVLWIEKLHLPFQSIWYGDWKKNISQYGNVIIFDRNLDWNVVRYIKKKEKSCRVIAWYWNITRKNFPEKFRKYCEVWSFDKQNCKQYNFKWNHQFYFKCIGRLQENTIFDAVFIGSDKGRYDKIMQMNRELLKREMKTYIGIVSEKTEKQNTNKQYIKPMDYSQILKKVEESRCIIDIPQEGQEGITLRVLEAMYFSKKLITTDRNIASYDFYCSDNIMIWDVEKCDCLFEFLNNPFKEIDNTILEKYSFEGWIASF